MCKKRVPKYCLNPEQYKETGCLDCEDCWHGEDGDYEDAWLDNLTMDNNDPIIQDDEFGDIYRRE